MNNEEQIIELEIKQIKIDQDIYPRDEVDQEQVNLYRYNLQELPPIIVSKDDYYLIDGMHRLQAHEIEGKTIIKAILQDLDGQSLEDKKFEILKQAIFTNSRHGKQLRDKEKKRLVRELWKFREQWDFELVFGVTGKTIRNWTADFRQQEKQDRNQKILDLYLQCLTYEEIGEKIDLDRTNVSRILNGYEKDGKVQNGILSILHNDLETQKPESFQITDEWRFPKRDPRFGTEGYPGSITGQVLENFLYYFSKPFDVVVDPMAGGGTTLDVCKSMYRKYLGYDLHPLKSRPDIQFNDVRKGYPAKAKNCDLIYLDPPYWHTMKYKEDSSDQISKEEFLSFVEIMANHSFDTVKKGGIVGFICEDVVKPVYKIYKGNPDDEMLSVIDLGQIFQRTGFELEWRISVPLPIGQYNGAKTDLAKEKKVMLHVVRDLLIWRRPDD
jgi:hypothetical protein